LKFDPDEGCDCRVTKLRGKTRGIPRFDFALYLPLQIGYIIDHAAVTGFDFSY
jgi:hypothetical protein